VDGAGNVIITGTSGNPADYLTIKYSAAGMPLWTNKYNGPAGGTDFPTALAADASGNIFVTGTSSQTSGSSSFADIATVKYSSAGVGLWTNRYADSWAVDGATDADGNFYLVGYSVDATAFVTLKYSGAGTLLWSNNFSQGANASVATALAVGSNGQIYVTGYSYRDIANYDYVTIAYSNSGTPLWTNRYDGPYGPDLPTALALDGNGNVFVTGYSYTTNLTYEYATVAYSASGSTLWTRRYGGVTGVESRAQSVAVDTNGNVFVTGYSSGASNYDFATIKYSNNGVPIWTNRFSNGLSFNNSNDQATRVAADRDGNVLVMGVSPNGNTNNDYLTIKYSGTGGTLWAIRYDGPPAANDRSSDLAIGPGNEVYVTGMSDANIVTVKYVTAPRLNIDRAANQVVLTWTNADFILQSGPDLGNSFTNIPGAISPYTNGITDERMYFRLRVK
jgi:hypothetical protein